MRQVKAKRLRKEAIKKGFRVKLFINDNGTIRGNELRTYKKAHK